MSYKLNFADVFKESGSILDGLLLTLQLTTTTFVFGIMLSVAVAATSVYGPPWARKLAGFYVDLFRNTPLIVQLFVIFFGLPALGLRLDPVTVATTGLVINMGAYGAEIVRAGLQSISKTQREAGFALGLSGFQVFRYIIFLPAIRNIYPALTSQLILIMLATSVTSQIATPELFYSGSILQSRTFRDFEVYIVISTIYLALAVALKLVFASVKQAIFRYP